MELKKTIEDFNLLRNCETLGIAVSGGVDSMALLFWFQENYKEVGLKKIYCINIEHGIRGEYSVKDSQFVKDYCYDNQIDVLDFKVDVPVSAKATKQTIEECARNERLKIFDKLIKEKVVDKIALGHHEQDQVETVLLHLFRGCGYNGLVGMQMERDGLIRPLLFTSKDEIKDYVFDNDIPNISDLTNYCSDYTRNFIRNMLIPQIKQVFPATLKTISRFSILGTQENDFLNRLGLELVFQDDNAVYIDLTKTKEPAVISRAIFIAMQRLGIVNDIFKVHIDSIIALAMNDSGKRIDMPSGIVVIKEYDRIAFVRDFVGKVSDSVIEFKVGQSVLDNLKIEVEKKNFEKVNFCCDLGSKELFIALNKVPDGAVIRFRRNGDIFKKFNGGTQKLNDYFTNIKVNMRERDSIPVLAKDSMIYAVLGFEISDYVKIAKGDESVSIKIVNWWNL